MNYKNNRKRLSIEEYKNGILNGNLSILSKAITLIESTLTSDNELSEKLIECLLPYSGKSIRIGITGVPGVGKSTFLESFGKYITSKGKKIAILAIDPSSQLTKGSILGDKTRMEELSKNPLAYIRPTASGNTLGGLHHKTRETIILCEAGGFEYIFVETVGVGQSETAVHSVVDFFLLLMLSGAGDELQGIKKGIMEMADSIVITKSDGDNIQKSMLAKRQYENALNLFAKNQNGWNPKVLTCSSLSGEGVKEIYNLIEDYISFTKKTGFFYERRVQQNKHWLFENINYHLKNNFFTNEHVNKNLSKFISKIENGELSALFASRELLKLFNKN